MCSLSKEQSMLLRETIQNAFFSELCPFFNSKFLSSIKNPIAERWHTHAVLLFQIKKSLIIHKFLHSPKQDAFEIYLGVAKKKHVCR